jgi:hypothetical protein
VAFYPPLKVSITAAAGGAALLILGLATCAHDQPFATPHNESDSTLTRGAERPLTYNLGADLRPAWLPDGSALVYTFENPFSDDHDRCLALLPPTGGTRTELPCTTTLASADSVDAFYEAAPATDGRMLFLREYSISGLLTPIRGALVLREKDGSDSTLLTYPYTAANGHLVQGIGFIRWLSDTKAVYLATTVNYPRPCGPCTADTVRTGIELVLLDLSASPASITPIPGTDSASSVDVGSTPDELFFTRNGDSRVYHLALSTGTVTIAHDFGTIGIARDVAVFGNQLYAVVRGSITYSVDPVLGPTQLDRGGALYVADLTTGSERWRIVDSRMFRRPVVSPDRSRMAAESFSFTVAPGSFDTTVSRSADLWLLELP